MKSLTLIRGLPGSGKSTLAAKLTSMQGGYDYHYEADQYMLVDGIYRFDPSKLSAAHKDCMNKTNDKLSLGYSVVVSNTFTTINELRPYFDIALMHNIIPNVIHCQGQYNSIHAVPDEAMKRMKNRFVYDISSLFNEFNEYIDTIKQSKAEIAFNNQH